MPPSSAQCRGTNGEGGRKWLLESAAIGSSAGTPIGQTRAGQIPSTMWARNFASSRWTIPSRGVGAPAETAQGELNDVLGDAPEA